MPQCKEGLAARDSATLMRATQAFLDMLDLASHIVETKAGHFDPSKFDDRYEDALKDLLKKKQEGKPSSGRSGGSRQTLSILWRRFDAVSRQAARLHQTRRQVVRQLGAEHPKNPSSQSGKKRGEPVS